MKRDQEMTVARMKLGRVLRMHAVRQFEPSNPRRMEHLEAVVELQTAARERMTRERLVVGRAMWLRQVL
jgi:hypothetical protein